MNLPFLDFLPNTISILKVILFYGVYDFPQTVRQILLDKKEFLCSEEELCLVISKLCFM